MKTIKASTKILMFAVMLVFVANVAKAQYVTITDPSFVTWLQTNYPGCMNGNQMDTTCPGIINATYANIGQTANAQDITGIQYFTNLTYLDCSWMNLHSLPVLPPHLDSLDCNTNMNITTIAMFPSTLQYINCDNNQITALPTLPPSLVKLICRSNHITSIPNFPSGLAYIDCMDNNLTSLPTLPNVLTYLSCSNNNLTTIPAIPNSLLTLNCNNNLITALPALPSNFQALSCGSNHLTSLPTLPATLTTLECGSNLLTTLPALPTGLLNLGFGHNQISNVSPFPPGLQYLDCSSTLMTTLPALPSTVQRLYCMGDSLTTLPALPLSLTLLNCANCHLTSLPSLPLLLQDINCSHNLLTSLPNLPNIMSYSFYCNDNPYLTCLPFLPNNYTDFRFDYTGVQCVPNYPPNCSMYMPNLLSLPLCNVINQNGCSAGWGITGFLYIDGNNNCIMDSGEVPLANKTIRLLDSSFNVIQSTTSYTNGRYGFTETVSGTYYLSVYDSLYPFSLSNCVSNSDTTIHLVNTTSTTTNINLPFNCHSGFDVGSISLINVSRFIPGHNSTLFLPCGNSFHCASGISGTVTCTINGAVTYSGFNGIPPSSVVSGSGVITAIWNIADYGNVDPYQFQLLLHVDTSAVIGQEVCITVNVTPIIGDYDTLNNNRTQCFGIFGSFDPNEKEVYPEGNIDPSLQWLTYTIQFQNTGTAPADNIYIIDTLDSHLDPFSLQVIAYNHLPLTQVYDNGIVRFNFPNINLPDSTTNEPASHGYVQYKVKLRQSYPVGTQIHNTAYIYFDYNAPVVTNTTENLINITTGIYSNNQKINMVYVYPNPNNGNFILEYQLTSANAVLEVKDFLGRNVFKQNIIGKDGKQSVDASYLSNGMYFYEIKTEGSGLQIPTKVRGKIVVEK